MTSMSQGGSISACRVLTMMNCKSVVSSAALILGAALFAGSALAPAQSSTTQSPYGGVPVEDIIARVNDQIITLTDYNRALKEADDAARQHGASTMQEINESHQNLLRDLIDQQLWLSKGKELNITGDTELVKKLDDIRKQYHMDSIDDLENGAKQQGISFEDFKSSIRNILITQRWAPVPPNPGSAMPACLRVYFSPPLDDVRVRRAIAASIDRQAISDKITFKRYPVVDTAQPLGSWARDPSVHLPAYDPATAVRLFDAAGWLRGADGVRVKNGKRLALTYVQFPESQTGVRAAAFIERALHARGIELTLKSVTNAKLFLPKAEGGALATGAFDLAYVPWPMGADPDDSFLLTCDAPANVMRWCDPQVDALERRALVAPSQADRTSLYSAIEHRVAAAVPIVYLFDPSYIYAYRTALRGFAPHAFNPTWNAADWRL